MTPDGEAKAGVRQDGARAAALLRRARLLEAVRQSDLARPVREEAISLLETAFSAGGDPRRRGILLEVRQLHERAAVLDREGYFDLADVLRAEGDNRIGELLSP